MILFLFSTEMHHSKNGLKVATLSPFVGLKSRTCAVLDRQMSHVHCMSSAQLLHASQSAYGQASTQSVAHDGIHCHSTTSSIFKFVQPFAATNRVIAAIFAHQHVTEVEICWQKNGKTRDVWWPLPQKLARWCCWCATSFERATRDLQENVKIIWTKSLAHIGQATKIGAFWRARTFWKFVTNFGLRHAFATAPSANWSSRCEEFEIVRQWM